MGGYSFCETKKSLWEDHFEKLSTCVLGIYERHIGHCLQDPLSAIYWSE